MGKNRKPFQNNILLCSVIRHCTCCRCVGYANESIEASEKNQITKKQYMTMKKLLFMLVCALLPITLWAQENEPYAVLSDNNTVLTFYYDDQKAARNGMSVGPFSSEGEREWNNANIRTSIQNVVFDSSFANCNSITSTRSWFSNCTGVKSITGIENLNTGNVENMAYMFNYCTALESLDLSTLNTSRVTDVNGMFHFCSSLKNLNLNGFNTANVIDMSNMFHACYILPSLDLSSFDTSNVTDMSYMFERCDLLTSLDLSNFRTPNVTDMHRMFYQCYSLANLDISNFNSEKVKTTNNMFGYCYALQNINLGGFSTLNNENISDMFARCTSLTTLDLSSFNTSKVTDMDALFYMCSSLSTIYVGNGWTTAAVKTAQGDNLFYGCTNLVGGAGTTYDVNHTDYTYARIDGGSNSPGYLTAGSAYRVVSDFEGNNTPDHWLGAHGDGSILITSYAYVSAGIYGLSILDDDGNVVASQNNIEIIGVR